MKAQRGSRGIVLLSFFNVGFRFGEGGGGQRHGLAALPPGKRPGTPSTGACGHCRCPELVRKISPPPGFFLFSLCTFLLLCPDCPGCAFCPYFTIQISMPMAGFEPAIPASDRSQTLVLDRSATGIRSRDRPARSESV